MDGGREERREKREYTDWTDVNKVMQTYERHDIATWLSAEKITREDITEHKCVIEQYKDICSQRNTFDLTLTHSYLINIQ